ncbi:glycosyltransferase family 2 protein [Sulfitobacter aestuariivivens]|uniref:Glycosyltransferase n=1 Tax=Sulfitobacter aestuariivivens TaxID=2766981 RepID=A0A927D3I8_9RHOB|nr:glycosyltransferase family 2 protein [Sulfitobacter aestuariivivens]MBD3663726.1 glycosyltransferase [Sulfitobacter aestuariivivens]
MSNLRLHLPTPQIAAPAAARLPLGRHLVNEGHIDQNDLVHALELQCHVDAPLGEILISEGLLTRDGLLDALARQHVAERVDLDADLPDASLRACLPASLCLKYKVVPWMPMGETILVATSEPHRFDQLRACMGPDGRRLLPVVASDLQVQDHLSRLYGSELAQKAATRVPSVESCRSWEINSKRRQLWAVGIAALIVLALILAPLWTLTIATLWAFVTLVMATVLKAAAFVSHVSRTVPDQGEETARMATAFRMPRVSILVPLLKEKEIAGVLIKRLSRLTYPKSLLNVVLVLEEGDSVTRDTIARTDMPDWMAVIEVPAANRLTTKPRALNYAMDFCKGSIIGVWDAEDAPEPDQIERVVNRFQQAPANVACLQGVLDYYNTRTNWLSRCFTIEYATWWRVLLPGVARLGLVIPLGGTTLFFRRDILEKLCGWDAHNVTEDADLGVRLARHGYVTELLPTVTYEEANCRAWPWVRQRSRWLKGFLITWCVHMRDPAALLKDLGWTRFLGVQTMLLATFSQFACAPLLWSFWLTLLGVPHPVELTLGVSVLQVMIAFFIVSELLNLAISATAVSGPKHRHLMGWVLTLPFYFPMGALAAYKALHEFIVSPFYWDKTQHGIAGETG